MTKNYDINNAIKNAVCQTQPPTTVVANDPIGERSDAGLDYQSTQSITIEELVDRIADSDSSEIDLSFMEEAQ